MRTTESLIDSWKAILDECHDRIDQAIQPPLSENDRVILDAVGAAHREIHRLNMLCRNIDEVRPDGS